jgi:transcriptional regulator with XRE-family HTH domain
VRRERKLFFSDDCAVKQTITMRRHCYGRSIEDHAQLNVIGPQVRRFRIRKGWSQERLAAKLQLFGWDTSRESVTRMENGDRRVPDLELFVVAKVLSVKTDELFPRNLRGKVKEFGPLYRVKFSRGQVPPEPARKVISKRGKRRA